MGLFDKKYCNICGEKIGFLGNRKLEDGNLCKDCAKKLSPWFSERRSSTVDEIREQLLWREANRARAAQFSATRSFGERAKLLLDEKHQWFTVTRAVNPAEDNSDVLDFSVITGCRMDIDQRRTELKIETKDNEGKTVRRSYSPPRYEYDYDFYLIISVNLPYFNEMKFQVNDRPVHIPFRPAGIQRTGGIFVQSSEGEPLYDSFYRSYKETCQEVCDLLSHLPGQTPGQTAADAAFQKALRYVSWICPSCQWPNSGAAVCQHCGAPLSDETVLSRVRSLAYATSLQENTSQSWTCPHCGTENTGKFCQNCGGEKSAAPVRRCSRCGWEPEDAALSPKFCPECGQPF